MLKKIFRIILEILFIIVSYIVQIYIINNINFGGVNGDLCLMLIAIITLIEKNRVVYIISTICGITSDLLFSDTLGKYILIYLVVTSVLIGLKKIYKQNSKLAIVVFSIIAVLISEVLLSIFNLVITGSFVNIFILLLNVFKAIIINVIISFVLYFVVKLVKKESLENK